MCVYVCMCLCVRACTYACVCVCVHACVCLCLYSIFGNKWLIININVVFSQYFVMHTFICDSPDLIWAQQWSLKQGIKGVIRDCDDH